MINAKNKDAFIFWYKCIDCIYILNISSTLTAQKSIKVIIVFFIYKIMDTYFFDTYIIIMFYIII